MSVLDFSNEWVLITWSAFWVVWKNSVFLHLWWNKLSSSCKSQQHTMQVYFYFFQSLIIFYFRFANFSIILASARWTKASRGLTNFMHEFSETSRTSCPVVNLNAERTYYPDMSTPCLESKPVSPSLTWLTWNTLRCKFLVLYLERQAYKPLKIYAFSSTFF